MTQAKQKRDERTEIRYKNTTLHPYIYDKTQQDLVTCCMLVIRREMSRIISSFFQLDGHFYLSPRLDIGQQKKDLEERLINFDISVGFLKDMSTSQCV